MVNNKLQVSGIIKESIVDGEGLRYVIFVQGCNHNCLGCHNPGTHDINGGTSMNIKDILEDIKSHPFIDGVTFSGGEPFLQPKALYKLAKEIKMLNLDLWCYTGYYMDQLISMNNEDINNLLSVVDVLVDGPFIQDKKDLSLDFRGSSNQTIHYLKR